MKLEKLAVSLDEQELLELEVLNPLTGSHIRRRIYAVLDIYAATHA